jgi:type II secretion system protein H
MNRPPPSRCADASRGPPPAAGLCAFTLIELLVVVALVALVSGVAALSVGTADEQHLDMAVVQIGDALQWAQAQARSGRQPVAVVFDTTGDRLAVVDRNGSILPDPLTRAGYVVRFRYPNQPQLVSIAAADFGACGRAVIFDAQGVPLAGGTVTLAVASGSRTLSVDPATGSVCSDG